MESIESERRPLPWKEVAKRVEKNIRSTVVTGLFWPALERTLTEELLRRKKADPLAPVVVLVGSNLTGLYLSRRLGVLRGHANLRFITFLDIARALGEQALTLRGGRPLPAGGGSRITARACAALPSGAYYAEIAGRCGFHDALDRTIQELCDCGFDERSFDSTVREVSSAIGMGTRATELASLFTDYRCGLAGTFYDLADLFAVATANAADFIKVFGTDVLFSYGLYDMTEIQRRLFSALSRVVSIQALVPYVDTPAYGFVVPTLEWLQAIGFDRVEAAGGITEESINDLRRLQERIFLPSVPVQTGDRADLCGGSREASRSNGPAEADEVDEPAEADGPDGSVTILSAPGEAAEVREMVRRILDLAAAGVPFHEMAILCRNLELYAPLVREILDAAGIPYYLPGGPGLDSTPAGRGLILFLNMPDGDFPRQAVLEWAQAAPLDVARFGAPAGFDPCVWDELTAAARIVGGREQWLERLDALRRREWGSWQRAQVPPEAGGAPDESLDVDESLVAMADTADMAGMAAMAEWRYRAARALERVVSALVSHADAFTPQGSWAAYAGAAVEVARAFLRPGSDRDGVVAAVETLARLEQVEKTISLDVFRTMVERVLAEPGQEGRFQRGGISVLDVVQARGLSFSAVFIPGMVEKSFPVQAQQDPFLLDREREAINAAVAEEAGMCHRGDGAGPLPLKNRRGQEEMLLFTLAVQSARDYLVLSFPRVEAATGRTRLASSYLLRVAEALGGSGFVRLPGGLAGVGRTGIDRAGVGFALAPAIDESEVMLSVLSGLSATASSSILSAGYAGVRRAIAAGAARWGERVFTPFDGVLSPAALDALAQVHPPASPVSATNLEAYATCPYRYFVERVLRVQAREEPERDLRITPLERGRLVHEVLEHFFRGLRDDGLLPLNRSRAGEAWQRLCTVAADAFARWEAAGLTGYPALWEVDRAEILAALSLFFEDELDGADGLAPAHFELGFGYGDAGGAPAAVLDLGDGVVVSVRGRIDRIDMSDDGRRLRVIDYKTGKLEQNDNRWAGGTALQLPIYLLAAARIFERDSLVGVEARYVSVRTNGRRRVVFHGGFLEENRDIFDRILATVVGGVRNGRYFAFTGQHCDYCDVALACLPRRAAETLFQRKCADGTAADFLSLKGVS